jgi:hypothetical protein
VPNYTIACSLREREFPRKQRLNWLDQFRRLRMRAYSCVITIGLICVLVLSPAEFLDPSIHRGLRAENQRLRESPLARSRDGICALSALDGGNEGGIERADISRRVAAWKPLGYTDKRIETTDDSRLAGDQLVFRSFFRRFSVVRVALRLSASELNCVVRLQLRSPRACDPRMRAERVSARAC